MTFRLALIVPLLAVSPAAAQDRSVGITYAPSLSLHSKVGCCMAAGAWITIDRLHVEYVAAWDFYRWKLRAEYAAEYAGRSGFFTEPDAIVDGQVLTVLWALRSWRTPQFRTRFEVGVRHGTAVDPIPRASGAGAGVTVDYGDGPIVLRGSGRFLWPKPPEFPDRPRLPVLNRSRRWPSGRAGRGRPMVIPCRGCEDDLLPWS